MADSRRAADAAEAAARAAEMSADADQRLAQLETAGLHDSYAPRFEGRWRFEKSQLQDGSRHLVYQFKLDRDYRIEAIAWTMNRAGQIGPPTVTPPSAPGGDWTIWVEQWSRDRTHSEVRELELRFWSPRAVPGRAKPWECRCGGPGPDDSAPHWDAIVKVTPPPPVKVVVPS
ncbi:hypothetical protein [Actinoplanes sp. NPDC051411]|uniref:hypothetical protein n=1 Tax=Actinoplanes sp. NPDC051411 TaxID=3155522 RepID=UPI00342BAC4E